MSKLLFFGTASAWCLKDIADAWRGKNEVGWLFLPGLETKTENNMFVYAKTPEICDLIGQIILCAKECVFELAWRCQFWPGSILHFYLALPGLDEKTDK